MIKKGDIVEGLGPISGFPLGVVISSSSKHYVIVWPTAGLTQKVEHGYEYIQKIKEKNK